MTTRILVGDCLKRLKDLPSQSVHCVVTSPPYWGLRSYKGETGMIGLDPTFEEHLENLLAVFREVWRVLRDDGTVWLNYGDAYAGGGRGTTPGKGAIQWQNQGSLTIKPSHPKGYKAKDLMLMPTYVAGALRDDGWWLRSEIVWHKPNPMPESAKDRPTCAHEKLFLLTKQPRYFYDHIAVRTKTKDSSIVRDRYAPTGRHINPQEHDARREKWHKEKANNVPGGWASNEAKELGGANLRNVWKIPTQGYKEAHFATFPPALVEPCIKAGTSEYGVCGQCHAPFIRVVDETRFNHKKNASESRLEERKTSRYFKEKVDQSIETCGWTKTCECESSETAKAVVLDPFGGSGTVALVAERLHRDAILIEISKEYAQMADRRITKESPLFAKVNIE